MVDVYSNILGNSVEPGDSALEGENFVVKNSTRKRKKSEITPEIRKKLKQF